MMGTLNSDQIDHVLQMQVYGRLACHANNRLYIVPISYGYDGKYVYAHSREGLKIEMLRKNPEICFQADIVDNLSSWRSVILWGIYEELAAGQLQEKAKKMLEDRFALLNTSESIYVPPQNIHPPQSVEKKMRPVYFRIKIKEKTGRFERGHGNK
jgi:nitroimidazol reductase NimA-like FMN-containing flavoprotein (pyridoxamine 5'-phosphate oxidase superfamily)